MAAVPALPSQKKKCCKKLAPGSVSSGDPAAIPGGPRIREFYCLQWEIDVAVYWCAAELYGSRSAVCTVQQLRGITELGSHEKGISCYTIAR